MAAAPVLLESCRSALEFMASWERAQKIQERVEAGPQDGDVRSLRGIDFQWPSLTTVYRLLQELGDE